MITLTVADIKKIAGGSAPLAREMVPFVNGYAPQFGVDTVDRMSAFLGQVAVESMFKHRGEIWGPTEAQKRYEGRADLGNTKRGDGSKYRGYGGIQVTGRANTTEFYNWCVANFPGETVPNFVEKPALMAEGKWWVIACFWYWTTRKLNPLADRWNIKAITKKVNGGYNHLAERIAASERARERLSSRGATRAAPAASLPLASPLDGLTGILTTVMPKSDQEEITPETIKTLQRLLFQKGYKFVGEDDGIYGDNTRDAGAAFRRDNKLPLAIDIDGDGDIEAEEMFDETFMSAIIGAGGRGVAENRKNKSTLDITKMVPEAANAKLSKIIALGTAGATGVPGIIGAMTSQFPSVRSMMQPIFDSMDFTPPPWVWFIILAVAMMGTWYFSRRSERASVEAYRVGERVAQ